VLAPAMSTSTSASIRAVTWNVLWRFDPDWRSRQAGIIEMLTRLRPDVVGLQECWAHGQRSQAHVLAERLGMHAAFVGPSLPPPPAPPERPDHDGVALGVGLVSRWPIDDLTAVTLVVTHRQVPPRALVACIRHPDGPFEVIVAATEWEPAFADDHLAQTTMLAALLGHEGSTPRMLLADLNCDPTQPEFTPLAMEIEDAWVQGNGEPDAVTLSSSVPFAPLEAVKQIDRRIDHILVVHDGKVQVERAFVVPDPVRGAYPSDHFPVVADLRIDPVSA
jgi:endonuclease/exonuclease/phosphatase family metal-dependent hydrolase